MKIEVFYKSFKENQLSAYFNDGFIKLNKKIHLKLI